MCFSAPVSFLASGVLGAGGVAALKRAKNTPSRAFAAIPLLFGIQQAIEGVIWLSFGAPTFQLMAAHAYLLFSHVVWPIYIPFAVRALEPDPQRKRFLTVFSLFGIAVGLYLLRHVVYGPVSVAANGHGLEYRIDLPDLPGGLAAYVLATCGSCLASSRQMVRVFGLAMFGAFLLAFWAQRQALYSVWCFFAAILSLIVLAYLWNENPRAPKP